MGEGRLDSAASRRHNAPQAAAGHLAQTLGPGATIAMINPDRGDRYLDTIYNPEWLEENGFEILSRDDLESAVTKLEATPIAIHV